MQETWVQSLGQEDPLEKEMATHSSILAWKIPWIEDPGRIQSMGSQRVGHDWATSLHFTKVPRVSGEAYEFVSVILPRWLSGKESAYQCRRHRRLGFSPWVGKIPWRRKLQPITVLPGKCLGQGSLIGHCPWICKESDMTEWLSIHAYW